MQWYIYNAQGWILYHSYWHTIWYLWMDNSFFRNLLKAWSHLNGNKHKVSHFCCSVRNSMKHHFRRYFHDPDNKSSRYSFFYTWPGTDEIHDESDELCQVKSPLTRLRRDPMIEFNTRPIKHCITLKWRIFEKPSNHIKT